MMSEITINFNMFDLFTKERVVSNLNNTLVITMHWSGKEKRKKKKNIFLFI